MQALLTDLTFGKLTFQRPDRTKFQWKFTDQNKSTDHIQNLLPHFAILPTNIPTFSTDV